MITGTAADPSARAPPVYRSTNSSVGAEATRSGEQPAKTAAEAIATVAARARVIATVTAPVLAPVLAPEARANLSLRRINSADPLARACV